MSKIFLFFIGLCMVAAGTCLAIYDWSSSDSLNAGGKYIWISLILVYVGGYFGFRVWCEKEGALSYALLLPPSLMLAMNFYTTAFTVPLIEKADVHTLGIVKAKTKRLKGNMNLHEAYYYEYKVNGMVYGKSTFEHLKVGDTLNIKYLESNPHKHIYYIK